MLKISKYTIVFLFLIGCLLIPGKIFAQYPNLSLKNVPNLIYFQKGDVQISNPETSQAFYDNLKGTPRDYFIDFPSQGEPASGWELYLNISVPDPANKTGRYSADVSDSQGNTLYTLDGSSIDWQQYYDSSVRDYFLKGPELDEKFPAGKYKIEVYSLGHSTTGEANDLSAQAGNTGEYVLNVGKNESHNIQALLNIYWQLPLLKATFLKTSVLQFFLTPFGIAGIGVLGVVLIFLAFIYYLIGLIRRVIKHNQAKTLLLTSNGMQMKSDIIKLLEKPAYDVTVAFISTASKPVDNIEYLQRDWTVMKEELGFNIEEVDIEGKTESQVMKLLEFKDIIFVEGGNTFYLLKAMRACNFEKIIRKLLKNGTVYIGASAGSMVAGRTIKTANWKNGDKNIVKLKNLKGLNLVPFDIFVHYLPEHAEIIRKNTPWKRQREKLKILTDDQAILVQGKEIDLIGEGEAVII